MTGGTFHGAIVFTLGRQHMLVHERFQALDIAFRPVGKTKIHDALTLHDPLGQNQPCKLCVNVSQ
jgi:hypothetical protein